MTDKLFYVIKVTSNEIKLNPEFQCFSRGFNNIMIKSNACCERLLFIEKELVLIMPIRFGMVFLSAKTGLYH